MRVVAEQWEGQNQVVTKALMESWADGKVREIVQGEDFTCSMFAIRGTLGSWASSNGYRLRSTTRLLPEGTLRFAFVKRDAKD